MRDESSSPWRRIALGLLVFAVGAALAFAFLPEWRAGRPEHDKAFFIQKHRELAAKAGLRLAPGAPRVRLVTPTSYLAYTWHVLGDEARDWLSRVRAAAPDDIALFLQRATKVIVNPEEFEYNKWCWSGYAYEIEEA